jgi:DNA-binding SARP family transcriptional activator
MNPQINQLVKSIFRKETLDQCSVQELQQYADRHPYFGAVQLLLTKKMQAENHQGYNEQLQKTFLYFNNPLWVEQLLNETGNATIIKAGTTREKETSVAVSATAVSIAEEASVTVSAAIAQEEKTAPEKPFTKTEPADTGFVFEPYHTVDYFASQGIKLKEEDKPADKFGRQLKSFTEWLKTMKRLPVVEVAAAPVTHVEQKVEELAAHSITDREVVTETMAEVWEKQGNASKAIEIYHKLSLLEPAKSTYFAARIEELKKERK